MNALTTSTPAEIVTTSATADLARAAELATASKSDATRRAYAQDWATFVAYCERNGLDHDTTPAVAAWLGHLADSGTTWATVARRLAGVRAVYQARGVEDATAHPAVKAAAKGTRRELTVATRNERAPLLVADVRAMLATIGDCPRGRRDRALLLLGFAMGARRSELVALDVADLAFEARGVAVTIRKSKTDQAGAGRVVAVPMGKDAATCPVRALRSWLASAEITTGPIFRGVDRHGNVATTRLSDKAVALVVKDYAGRAGLDVERLAGHSLRAGLVTSAAMAGVDVATIQRTTGHASAAMVKRYTRIADAWAGGSAAGSLL
jgi:site-specific recombinase XerD